jgi:hypothetical protein
MEPLLWHYTTATKFREIARSGELRPATAYIAPGERPAVWFSTRQLWEPTAAKAFQTPDGSSRLLDMKGMHEHAGLVRLGVTRASAPYGWREFVEQSGVPKAMALAMAKAGRRMGADPGDWYVSFDPIVEARWAAIQEWTGSKWTRVERRSASLDGLVGATSRS